MIVDLAGALWLENISDEVDQLLADFVFTIVEAGTLQSVTTIVTVPKGFATDYCSVPLIPFVHELLGDIGKRAGLVHDYLYSRIVDPSLRRRGRAWADDVLYYALRAQGIGALRARAMWSGVRMAGSRYFQPLDADELERIEPTPASSPADPRGLPNY